MKLILNKVRELNQYIKSQLLTFFLVLLSVQILTAIISFFVITVFCPQHMEEYTHYMESLFNDDGLLNKKGFSLFIGLFKHNSIVSAGSFFCGSVPFLFLPLWSTVQNGFVSGMVYSIGTLVLDENIVFIWLKYVLPHGIFEIPATLLADAIGMRWCLLLTKKILGKGKGESLWHHLKNFYYVFLLYIIPLLLIAAFIEGIVERLVFGI